MIVFRAMKPNFGRGQDRWGTVPFYVYSAIAIVSFFAFGLFYTPKTNIVVADFWRWWVVHTWVEGIFEFFAAAAIAYVVTALGLAPKRKALRAAYLTASLALFSGIIGVGHHYYWFGDPDLWLALGGVAFLADGHAALFPGDLIREIHVHPERVALQPVGPRGERAGRHHGTVHRRKRRQSRLPPR